MFLDAENLFSEAQAVTTGSGTGINSTNVIDLGSRVPDLGVGEDLYLVVEITTAMTDGSSNSALGVALAQDADSAFGSPTAIQTIGSFAALSAVGSRLVAKIQPGIITERYLGLIYTSTNGDLTTGAVTAFLTKDIDAFKAYPNNYTVA
jgi:predicted RecA/RadA family phage recombinase